jgi:LDH2 family malate/lactate/ureidoglycolate dehydrogenase
MANVICPAESLEGFVRQVVRGMGASEEIAAEVARHLVRSNLSGHDSHGVLRMPQYVRQADGGTLVPAARPTIERESPVTALIDAHRSFGHYSTAYALDWAMAHAREHGLAAVAVRHSSHIGRLGEYTERAAEQGLIAMVTVGAGGPGVGGMVLFGGRKRFFGANPWSIGVPGQDRSMMFDGSTSTVAEGKVRFALAKGTALPPGCIIDRDGNPTTNPADFYAGGALVPLGGELAGHKGYGLAMASALISGLAMIDDPEPTLIGASVLENETDERGQIAGVFLIVVDPGCFGDAGSYRALVQETLDAAKRVPPAPGASEVLLPGEPEVRTRVQRTRHGIALPESTWEELRAVGQRFGVAMPELSGRET